MKVALITGSSRGIGKEIAKVFAKNGYSVVICYNKSKEDAQNLCEEIIKFGGRAIIFKVDVTNIEDIKNMLKYTIYCFGHIDVLINNAGIAHKALLIDEDMNEIDSIIDTNLKGTINVTKFALPYMLKNGGGKIINISSIWGSEGASCESVYSASKAGIIGFTRSIAKEYAYNNITANCICPGVVDTDMNKNLSEKELEELVESIPQKRMLKGEEIGELALFLANKTGDYITGQSIVIDGGLLL